MTSPVVPSVNSSLTAKLGAANENVWVHMGTISESMNDNDKALYCYENALKHNPYNIKALTQVATFCRVREQYPKAVDYFQRILNIESNNGEIWGALGHCYLMMDDLQKAYTAYQQALYHLPNPKDPNLWYGIGILYDRYGSFEHAEEAFTAVLKMDQKFEKANEIYFRLGIIYKQQQKYEQSLKCFRYILSTPPRPLAQGDIWFQIGHVHELKKEFQAAKEAYEKVLKENPNHAKVLQQLGWLYHHNTGSGMKDQDLAISYLNRSVEADPNDGQTWYLLGRCYMGQQKYRKAYDAYQQAVYRDGRNPTFWCSIGVLYYQINQYRDALDAYSRAIRLNPYLSEVWYDLGTLYESCNQISDSLDAYQRAAELDSNNKHIQQRLTMLRAQLNGEVVPQAASQQQQQQHKSKPANVNHKSNGHSKMDGREGGIHMGGMGGVMSLQGEHIVEKMEKDIDGDDMNTDKDSDRLNPHYHHEHPRINMSMENHEIIPPMNTRDEDNSHHERTSANSSRLDSGSLRANEDGMDDKDTRNKEYGVSNGRDREKELIITKVEPHELANNGQKRGDMNKKYSTNPTGKPNTADLLADALSKSRKPNEDRDKFGGNESAFGAPVPSSMRRQPHPDDLASKNGSSLQTAPNQAKSSRKRASSGKSKRNNADGQGVDEKKRSKAPENGK